MRLVCMLRTVVRPPRPRCARVLARGRVGRSRRAKALGAGCGVWKFVVHV
jgi:hypothetical protein